MAKIHFIGIGGIGMSALASLQLARRNIVSGSDLKPNTLIKELSKRGAVIYKDHSENNITEDMDLVVKSTCIRDDNPEIKRAKELGLPIIWRGEMLKDVMTEYPLSIAVTGTHGKTTTSSLISYISECCGKNPTILVGGEMKNIGTNAKFAKGSMVVAEVDESDGYFRNISATCSVVTNIEREHMEHYTSWEDILSAYEEFIGRVPKQGIFVYSGEDPSLKKLRKASSGRCLSFGIEGSYDVTCRDYTYTKSIECELIIHNRSLGRFSSKLFGRHNLMNILAAAGLCIELGFDRKKVAKAISSFLGVKRRFESVGTIGTIRVIEDYAHHPTEIKSVITAASNFTQDRVIVIFQPHRYSRTQDLMQEFSECFYGSDILILTDIYSASEDAIKGVSVKGIYERIDKESFEKVEVVEKEKIPGYVSSLVKKNDMILVLGAGDICEIAPPLVNRIKERFNVK